MVRPKKKERKDPFIKEQRGEENRAESRGDTPNSKRTLNKTLKMIVKRCRFSIEMLNDSDGSWGNQWLLLLANGWLSAIANNTAS